MGSEDVRWEETDERVGDKGYPEGGVLPDGGGWKPGSRSKVSAPTPFPTPHPLPAHRKTQEDVAQAVAIEAASSSRAPPPPLFAADGASAPAAPPIPAANAAPSQVASAAESRPDATNEQSNPMHTVADRLRSSGAKTFKEAACRGLTNPFVHTPKSGKMFVALLDSIAEYKRRYAQCQ